MSRPVMLDLCCGAGGSAVGYHRAGYDLVGVDHVPQPNYPYEFVLGDALTFPLEGFDAITASPPCHDHSTVTGRDRKLKGPKGTGYMLAAMLQRLSAHGAPFIVENIERAAAWPEGVPTVRLCGSSFGLDVRRHRRFASNVSLTAPPCDHAWQTPRFRTLDYHDWQAGKRASVVGVHGKLNYAGEREIRERAMGIDWMTVAELSQAIPPAYTEHLGKQLIRLEVRPTVKKRALRWRVSGETDSVGMTGAGE